MIRVGTGTHNLGLLIRRLFLLMTRIEPMSENAAARCDNNRPSPRRRRCVTAPQRSANVPDRR